jgi:F-type H+-transporting ATPase subunit epsilon
MKLFTLEIITQETVLYQDTAQSITAPASEGEVTILAHHAPFFSKINPGQITIRKGKVETNIITGRGFIDVSPDNKVTLLVDSATRASEIDIRKAEEAKLRAEELLSEKAKLSKTEIIRAEASLRKAVLELKVSRRKKLKSPFSSQV